MALSTFATPTCALLLCLGLSACNNIYQGDQLSAKEIAQIRTLGLLSADEKIYQFYSNNRGVKGAGNFYTTKRIAHYWLTKRDRQVDFAYYRDVARISLTSHPAGDFTIPFLTIVRKDSTQFRIYVDGNEPEISKFFLGCRSHWQAGR
jgi:hypothetical protein